MPANGILVFPGKAKLEVVAGNSFVHDDRARVLRRRAPEVTEISRRRVHVTNAILLEPRRGSEVVGFAETCEGVQVFGHWSQGVVLHPIGHAEDSVLLEKLAD